MIIAGAGFALMAWREAWRRALPMFPNEWRKGHWPEPRDTVDIVALPASHEFYRITDNAYWKWCSGPRVGEKVRL